MDVRSFRNKLLRWYHRSNRPLPWRKTRDPYAIWVSEILLQQTRVGTAIDYYGRFLDRFPTLSDLAGASVEEVLQVWQGLGYYSRARNLHRAARLVQERFRGRIPRDPAALKALPGIGPYTAAAIASIAFGKDAAVLDGNVARVLCRVAGLEASPSLPSTRKLLQQMADRLLPRGRSGAFNQAIMDLGALVCKPARPACSACPVRQLCTAFLEGTAERLPLRTAKAALPVRVRLVAAVDYRGRLLFRRRPLEGLLGGLWELPGIYLADRESPGEGLKRLCNGLKGRLADGSRPETEVLSVKHLYSHFEERNRVFRLPGKGGRHPRRPQEEPTYRWLHPTRLNPYPVTGATRKILDRLGVAKGSDRKR